MVTLVYLEKGSPALEVRRNLIELSWRQPGISFVLLQSNDDGPLASRVELDAAIRSRFFLISQGINVIETLVGNALPRRAIAVEVGRGVHDYAGVFLALRQHTLPTSSRIAAQLERHLSLPVTVLPLAAGIANSTSQDLDA